MLRRLTDLNVSFKFKDFLNLPMGCQGASSILDAGLFQDFLNLKYAV